MKKRTRLEKVRLDAEENFDWLYMNTPEDTHEIIREFGRLRFEEGILVIQFPETEKLGTQRSALIEKKGQNA